MYIDAHCHLSDQQMAPFLDRYLDEALSHNVAGFVFAGVDSSDWQRQLELEKKYDSFQFKKAFGIHPWVVIESEESELKLQWQVYRKMISKADAVGETGLDFSRGRRRQPLQEHYFRLHIEDAITRSLPIILHVVKGHEETLKILSDYSGHTFSGIVHSFQSSPQIAERYLQCGLYPSFHAATLVKNKKLLGLFLNLLGRSVIETDAPHRSADENPLLALIRLKALLEANHGDLLEESSSLLKKIFKFSGG